MPMVRDSLLVSFPALKIASFHTGTDDMDEDTLKSVLADWNEPAGYLVGPEKPTLLKKFSEEIQYAERPRLQLFQPWLGLAL